MVRVRSGEYFILISRIFPGRFGSSRTENPSMYPSRCSSAARFSFSFEEGIGTDSCIATLALRTRVSRSAIGSVIVIAGLLSPARLRHARDLPGVDQLPQADAAQPELAEHGPRPAATLATRVPPHLELGLFGLLDLERLLGHVVLLPLALEREAERVQE